MNFGDRLKIVRMSRELSVDELATLANLTAKKIRQIERRGDRPSLPTV
ncbi:MAG: helix-turn-helix domain-containing protein, partial [Selenomonadaceae bacterium]|nr:helix-turn-helix domain-containing protein [Selenomonadaceae bacterium]